MTDHESAVLAAAEGVGADIAWIVVYVMCWFFVVFPFVLWYCGVRTPRADRRVRGGTAVDADSSDASDEGTRLAG